MPTSEVEVVSEAKIREVAALAEDKKRKQHTGHGSSGDENSSIPRIDAERYLSEYDVTYKTKACKGGMVYRLEECPFDFNHGGRGETAIIQADGGLVTFHCKHNSCQSRRWQDVVSTIGKVKQHHLSGLQNGSNDRKSGAPDPTDDHSSADPSSDSDRNPDDLPRFANLLNSTDFKAADFHQEFLIRNVLVKGQPGVIGGRTKVLKTTIAIDLVIALGSGSKFLDEFEATKANVGFWSGESGAAVIQETAKRIAVSREVELADCSIQWGFDLPKLSRPADLNTLAFLIQRHALDVVVVDPLYLSLLTPEDAGRPSDLYFMGGKLLALSELGASTGCTMLVLHHFRKTGIVDEWEPVGLEELAQSGVAEWCRQWVLLARRTPYEHDGCHDLWMRVGGSAGHAGLWNLHIDEGLLDPCSLGGRKWDVEVKNIQNAREAARQEKENKKARELEERENRYRQRLLEALAQFPNGETERQLRSVAGLNSGNFGKAITTLLKEQRVETCEVVKRNRSYDGFKLTNV
jgi:replicative DNA helicase